MTSKRKAPRSAFKPGQSGNPGGRPKSSLSKTIARILTEKFPGSKCTNEEHLARAIVKSAIEGDKDMRHLIFDRLEGKVLQPVGVGGDPDAGPVRFTLSLGDGVAA